MIYFILLFLTNICCVKNKIEHINIQPNNYWVFPLLGCDHCEAVNICRPSPMWGTSICDPRVGSRIKKLQSFCLCFFIFQKDTKDPIITSGYRIVTHPICELFFHAIKMYLKTFNSTQIIIIIGELESFIFKLVSGHNYPKALISVSLLRIPDSYDAKIAKICNLWPLNYMPECPELQIFAS